MPPVRTEYLGPPSLPPYAFWSFTYVIAPSGPGQGSALSGSVRAVGGCSPARPCYLISARPADLPMSLYVFGTFTDVRFVTERRQMPLPDVPIPLHNAQGYG